MPELTVRANGLTMKVKTSCGASLFNVLKEHGLAPHTPCNGKGTCGKCKVLIINGSDSFSPQEKRLLNEAERAANIHLACETFISGDVEIEVPGRESEAAILTDMSFEVPVVCPPVRKKYLELPFPSLSDQKSDEERLLNALGGNMNLSLDLLHHLPDAVRSGHFKITAVYGVNSVTGVEPGNTGNVLYGIAVDIGTTTVAAYLYDLRDGRRLSEASVLNPQRKFGADVITRIGYASGSRERRQEMRCVLLDALNDLFAGLAGRNGLSGADIYLVTVAGNTTMIHLLLGIPASAMAAAPFIPVTTRMRVLDPVVAGLSINPGGRIIFLPMLSAYVGADTVAAVLSTEMHRKGEISLLLDIGTNGEIVLGNDSFMLACSVAAGPAFEGAGISCGIGGVRGAISRLDGYDAGGFRFGTIGNELPVGLCGSGIVDAAAYMLKTGIIDETGRMAGTDELPVELSTLKKFIIRSSGQPAVLIVPAERTGHGGDIALTQKDIRELQNAKAAVAAGIRVLAKEAGLALTDIDKVYLAGGFGNYMNIDSALAIGLIPQELQGRIFTAGNAAGAGAVQAMLSEIKLGEADNIAGRIRYLELSSNPEFVREYTEQMLFPEPFEPTGTENGR